MSQIISRLCVVSLLNCEVEVFIDSRSEVLHGYISHNDLVRIQRAANLVKEGHFSQVRMHPGSNSDLGWFKDSIHSSLDGIDHEKYGERLDNWIGNRANVTCEEFIVSSDHFIIAASSRHLVEYGMQSGSFPIEALYDKTFETKSAVGTL